MLYFILKEMKKIRRPTNSAPAMHCSGYKGNRDAGEIAGVYGEIEVELRFCNGTQSSLYYSLILSDTVHRMPSSVTEGPASIQIQYGT
jgi:hypothetical protein